MSEKRPPKDINELAKYILDATTGETEKIVPPEKNAHAVALSKLGAAKGGKATAEKMTAEQLKDRAEKAAKARWNKK